MRVGDSRGIVQRQDALFCLLIAVYIGRRLMQLWMGSSDEARSIHELYTAACGLYTCWLSLRGVTVLYHWLPQGASVILNKLREWAMLVSQ